jgi:hypothetical protein
MLNNTQPSARNVHGGWIGWAGSKEDVLTVVTILLGAIGKVVERGLVAMTKSVMARKVSLARPHEGNVSEEKGIEIATLVERGLSQRIPILGLCPFAATAASSELDFEPVAETLVQAVGRLIVPKLNQTVLHGHGVRLAAVGDIFPTL